MGSKIEDRLEACLTVVPLTKMNNLGVENFLNNSFC